MKICLAHWCIDSGKLKNEDLRKHTLRCFNFTDQAIGSVENCNIEGLRCVSGYAATVKNHSVVLLWFRITCNDLRSCFEQITVTLFLQVFCAVYTLFLLYVWWLQNGYIKVAIWCTKSWPPFIRARKSVRSFWAAMNTDESKREQKTCMSIYFLCSSLRWELSVILDKLASLVVAGVIVITIMSVV